MELGRLESLTLVAAMIGASALGSATLSMGFGASTVGDIAILLALFAFDGLAARSGSQSIAFAAAASFCSLTPLFFLAYTVLGVPLPGSPSSSSPWTVFGVWVVVSLILFSVDRFRMSARDNVSLAASGLAGATPGPILASTPPPAYRPAPIRVEPVAPAVSYAPPPPRSIEEPQPVFASPAAAVATAPAPDVLAIAPGREALIYLNLVGEGLNVLRTVRAENLGRDYYRIADIMPENEQWEFTPGQVVKCRKKALSNGKHMVAYEEAPRAL